MRRVLFYRDIRRFTGGHLKVKHYFDHVAQLPGYQPTIHFAPTTVWNAANPWCGTTVSRTDRWAPEEAAILFLGGVDWRMLPRRQQRRFSVPIINLVQHVRHADPRLHLYRFLRNRAVRICVSPEVEEAILATGRVNGPVLTIPNCIDLDALPAPVAESARPDQVLIAGNKEPRRAQLIAESLARRGIPHEVLIAPLPHRAFLERLRIAPITLFLPNAREGFYLPALEGMALGTLVICPDCIGNRSFCRPGQNCYRPAYNVEDVVEAVRSARGLSPTQIAQLIRCGRETAESHRLEKERQAFHEILQRVDRLWAGND